MRSYDPAISGFITHQSIDIRKENAFGSESGIESEGIVVGAGASIVWE